MAIAELIAGTEAVGATEWSLATDTSYDTGDAQTTDGVFQFFLDLSDMIAGDQLRIRVYEKVRAADTQRIVYQSILSGEQSEPIWVSPSVILMHGWDISCTALAGTITVNWSIRQVA
jgi:hypothetical protein